MSEVLEVIADYLLTEYDLKMRRSALDRLYVIHTYSGSRIFLEVNSGFLQIEKYQEHTLELFARFELANPAATERIIRTILSAIGHWDIPDLDITHENRTSYGDCRISSD